MSNLNLLLVSKPIEDSPPPIGPDVYLQPAPDNTYTYVQPAPDTAFTYVVPA